MYGMYVMYGWYLWMCDYNFIQYIKTQIADKTHCHARYQNVIDVLWWLNGKMADGKITAVLNEP